jgi:hypothetical protein
MASVSSPPRPVGAAAPPPVRHGTCRLELWINGTRYTIRRMPAPEGFRTVFTLRKRSEGATAVYTVALPKGSQPACTCPDHEQHNSTCKHIMSLAAHGLIPQPKAARPVKPRTRKAHAGNARKAIAEASALTAEQRRHLAAIAGPIPEGWEIGGAGMAALASAGTTAAPSFAEGFRKAVADHIARRDGTAPAEAEWPICEGCGCDFDPEISRDPSFCEACMSEGGAA